MEAPYGTISVVDLSLHILRHMNLFCKKKPSQFHSHWLWTLPFSNVKLILLSSIFFFSIDMK